MEIEIYREKEQCLDQLKKSSGSWKGNGWHSRLDLEEGGAEFPDKDGDAFDQCGEGEEHMSENMNRGSGICLEKRKMEIT